MRLYVSYDDLNDDATVLAGIAERVDRSTGVVRCRARGSGFACGAYAAVAERVLSGVTRLAARVEHGYAQVLTAHGEAAHRIATEVHRADEELAGRSRSARAGEGAPVSRSDRPHFTGASGEWAGRTFDADQAGGPVVRRDASVATIDSSGVAAVGRHLSRFVAPGEAMEPANAAMLSRLRRIARGSLEPTIYDKNFFTHELDEAARFSRLGIGDDEALWRGEMYEVWNQTHTAALADFGVTGTELFLPSVERGRTWPT